jgi:hypothetical protein
MKFIVEINGLFTEISFWRCIAQYYLSFEERSISFSFELNQYQSSNGIYCIVVDLKFRGED